MPTRQETATRLSISITVHMRYALDDLASRNGLNVASQATMLLRQALDRTMQTPAVQKRYNAHLAQRTAREWRNEQTQDWVVETTHANRRDPAGTAGE